MNQPLGDTETNRRKRAEVVAQLEGELALRLVRGFFGTTTVELSIKDGTINGFVVRAERRHQ